MRNYLVVYLLDFISYRITNFRLSKIPSNRKKILYMLKIAVDNKLYEK